MSAPVLETAPDPDGVDVTALVDGLRRSSWTVAVAESLTGGLVVAALVSVPGASTVLRGGVVAYATDLKARLLGVPERLLAERGTVDPDVAAAMALGVRTRLSATWGVATTGAAGPDSQDGAPPGSVFVAVSGPGGTRVRALRLVGDRAAVRAGATVAALRLLADGTAERRRSAAGERPEHAV